MKLTGFAKLLLAAVLATAFLGVGWYGVNKLGWGVHIGKASVAPKAALGDVNDQGASANVTLLPLPSSSKVDCPDGVIRSLNWAWNSQMGWFYSNGGPDTTKGSIAAKYGICVHFTRQDDNGQLASELVKCASELKDGNDCQDGAHFVTIMMDGSGQFIANLNPELIKACGKDCTAEIVGTSGFSRGEDKLMGPQAWKNNPKNALGDGLIAGVLRDGDWNIALKWAADNGLKNNPDEKTFDADAINWVNASTYTDAAEKYVAGYCEDRKAVKDGKLTGETINVCVKGIVTWTPGDVTAAKKKGGIVNVVSTRQYRAQMPSAIIGIKKWNRNHGEQVAKMLAAALEGGDQVKAFPEALQKAAEISYKIYAEETPAYWLKYYKGVTEPDATGKQVELGGSYVSNMNDALSLFGLIPGANNNAKTTYTVFANIVTQQYPEMFKKTPIPPYKDVFNTSYLSQANSLLENPSGQVEQVEYTHGGDTVSKRSYAIEFATGSAMLTAAGLGTVGQIKDSAAITGLSISLDGYTDNTGDATGNQRLSERRAASVKAALQQMAPNDFPNSRFEVHGHGQDNPVASNNTEDGKRRNRRVEVTLAQ